MITGYRGTGVIGTAILTTSVANAEIIPTNTRVTNFTIIADQAFVANINGGSNIYIRANQTTLIPICTSFKITTNGITYNWIGVA